MKNAPTVNTGDRVRVVLEGEVECYPSGPDFKIGQQSPNFIWPDNSHVVSVEVLPKPVKVGDKVTHENHDDLPWRTAVVSRHGIVAFKRGDGKWEHSNGGYALPSITAWDATILWLPPA